MLDIKTVRSTPTEYLAQMIDEVLEEAEGHKKISKIQTQNFYKEHFYEMYDSCIREADFYAKEIARR
jgi:hypothetical protein